MRAQQGFTLIELMVTVALVAILVGIAVPSFQGALNGNRLATSANELIASLQTARMEAIRRNRRVAVCMSANANAGQDATCASANVDGWITFVDLNADGDFDKASDTLLRNSSLSGPLLVSGDDQIVYRSDGLARGADGTTLMTAGRVRLRIDTTNPNRNVRCIDISTGGASVRPEASTTHDDDCT